MNQILDYLKEHHNLAICRYLVSPNKHTKISYNIAFQIMELLEARGRLPVILKIEGCGTDTNLLKLTDNSEIGFPEGVVWSNHYVCECDGVIYDPIYPEPLKRKEYFKKIFPKQKTRVQTIREIIKRKGRG